MSYQMGANFINAPFNNIPLDKCHPYHLQSEPFTFQYLSQDGQSIPNRFYEKKLTLEEHECQKMFELEEKKLTQQYELEKIKLEIEKLRAENEKVKLGPCKVEIHITKFRTRKKCINNGTSKGGSMHDKQNMDNNGY
ncbi:unnamed protein product [Rhizophagus irregularis]|uniref:Uncharacterized protein n=3 Tax=Rhizophagus irregularis TaxID=588596 RepID=A0A916EF05_9GLOM|nr:unnamed protein product [Rhizophagus irregularis]CAB5382776.1 unnamed protein product [Rhizophagus irregularis]